VENGIEIRECVTVDEMAECVELQREVFALPESELSPVRHLVVTKNAGGWSLGAFDGDRLAGFVLCVPAFLRGERAFYSHMTGVRPEYQSRGVGARLKWAQRARALSEGVTRIRWTFEPVKARNAYFNLEKLGAVVLEFRHDFYGTDYAASGGSVGLAGDRLFAEWDLTGEKVATLSRGETYHEHREPAAMIEIMNDWTGLVAADPQAALKEQERIRSEFQEAFADGLVCRGFLRDEARPQFLLYHD
jgi:predicted GNAT superfamily acetyltransferase